MRSYSALALLSAIITVCLGAQSDRSRQRSSPVRSVPVAADIKRDVDFDCPEEFGYYPHPTDCTLYYVCVFGGALLESCTGGLMYSHELQTCDWPRNVGCDGAAVIGGEELERLNEREPPRRKSSSSRRTPPPPPPRAQPNPVITSRGQPKFSREQYEKQQQLYAEVDDLPPVEEIESDRQQRVYRGQPSTIGQVQKDRDGYVAQPANSGRNFNSNIIPASLSQSSKFGSFSFGSQVDDRRTASITPLPQSYSLEPTESVAPVSYSPSPRPKMLYNGSQNYNSDQYDPFYAVYDEDGELYKDADYVQQYNAPSIRPAVQQTYRGTPPPSRRPTENYTPRPVTHDDYDDALIQGQISNQNQYQSPVRHPTRLPTDEKPSSKPETSTNPPVLDPIYVVPSTAPSIVNFSSLAKPFEKTDNFYRLQSTLPTTQKISTSRYSSIVTNNKNKISVETTPPVTNKNKKKVLSLTSGFSIRRNMNNTDNPYTLTLLTRPVEEYNYLTKTHDRGISNREVNSGKYYDKSKVKSSSPNNESGSNSDNNLELERTSESAFRRKVTDTRINDDYDIPIYTNPASKTRGSSRTTVEMTSPLSVTAFVASTTPMPRSTPTSVITNSLSPTTKYYLKTISRRPTTITSQKQKKKIFY